ncbi:MAG: aldehyde ferredoxin oxidoreductase family protein [Nitrososphaerota archaeon]|nr:aldehyde ferredoxin oxidoreductase family protein [Candidatus Bathyarchaeota archaeon]MDW8061940.1 aldehyde ferredoxin oxidoreductase family protein [Nitrososphaerota archaeon]
MVELWGYTGRIARVNLSDGRAFIEEVKTEYIDLVLGGVGLASLMLFIEVDPRIDAFSPLNKLVFAVGPLTGTIVPGSSRAVVAARSPLTLGWGESHLGGFWGVELKKAGFDALLIEGKADTPTYIYIDDGEIEFRDASRLWGLKTSESEKTILSELEDPEVKVACIGPAGEKLVRYASIVSGERVAGRTGLGAVMGSKKLKAIAVRGRQQVRVRWFDKLRSMIARLYPSIMSFPTTQLLSSYGTNGEMDSFYQYGDVPIRNFTLGEWNGISKIEGQSMVRNYLKRHRACFGCPIGCWKEARINDPRYGLIEGRMPEYESAASLGSLLLNDDPASLIYMEKLCNDYGFDVISAGATIAWAIECFTKGLITIDDTKGLQLRWGDPDLIADLLEMIGERKGFGYMLGEGCRLASKIIGRGSERYAMHVKGLEMPMHDPRAFKGMGLQYATSNRGACHLQGLVMRVEQGERIPDLKIYRRFQRFEIEGKGWLVATMQDWHHVLESLGLCKFVQIPPGHVAGFYFLVAGVEKRLPELQRCGERISNIQRMFNIVAGVTSKDDILPDRFLSEPLGEGGAKGQVVELKPMIEEYYKVRGWDDRGIPTREKLKDLSILDIVESRLRSLGVDTWS